MEWRFLKKLKLELYDLAIPSPGVYPKKTVTQKDTRTPLCTAALYTTTRTQKQPKCLLMGGGRRRGICTQRSIRQKGAKPGHL